MKTIFKGKFKLNCYKIDSNNLATGLYYGEARLFIDYNVESQQGEIKE